LYELPIRIKDNQTQLFIHILSVSDCIIGGRQFL